MAKPYKIPELERQHGNLHAVIPRMVNKYGQAETARRLGVSQFTVSRWLSSNGYVLKRLYIRADQQAS